MKDIDGLQKRLDDLTGGYLQKLKENLNVLGMIDYNYIFQSVQCPECGKWVRNDYNHCPWCGEALKRL